MGYGIAKILVKNTNINTNFNMIFITIFYHPVLNEFTIFFEEDILSTTIAKKQVIPAYNWVWQRKSALEFVSPSTISFFDTRGVQLVLEHSTALKTLSLINIETANIWAKLCLLKVLLLSSCLVSSLPFNYLFSSFLLIFQANKFET